MELEFIDKRQEVCTMLTDRLNDAAITCARETGKPVAFWFLITMYACCEPLAKELKFTAKCKAIWRVARLLFRG